MLGGKRPLTLMMIRKVHAVMQIPAEILIATPSSAVRAQSVLPETAPPNRIR